MSASALHRAARVGLLIVLAFVAVTAFLGGAALAIGALVPTLASTLTPPTDYLAGTPFDGYLVPGLILGIIVSGTHLVAFILELRRHRWADLGAAVAGFAVLIWIFVQMVFIPFSFLQAAYFAAGLLEVGLVMIRLRLFDRMPERVGIASQ